MSEPAVHATDGNPDGADALLDRFLDRWLGAWPPKGGLTIVGCELRDQPGWDGAVRPFVGVETPDGAVLSVSPRHLDSVRALGTDLEQIGQGLAAALGRPCGSSARVSSDGRPTRRRATTPACGCRPTIPGSHHG